MTPTASQIEDIFDRYLDGDPPALIANDYGMLVPEMKKLIRRRKAAEPNKHRKNWELRTTARRMLAKGYNREVIIANFGDVLD